MKNQYGTTHHGGVAYNELLIQEYKSSLVHTLFRQLERDAILLKDMIRAYNDKSIIQILDHNIIVDLIFNPFLNNTEEKSALVDFILYLLCKESPLPKMTVKALKTIFHF